MKIANICATRFRVICGDWERMYLNIFSALHRLGYEVRISPFLEFPGLKKLPEYVKSGIQDNIEHLYIYNHTYIESIQCSRNFLPKNVLFVKPTGPEPECYSIDPLGFSSSSAITYNEPSFLNINYAEFFDNKATEIIEKKTHKWSNRTDLILDQKLTENLPKDFTLVVGQVPDDSTITDMTLGEHWKKQKNIVLDLLNKSKFPVVLKLHPSLKEEASKEDWEYIYKKDIIEFRKKGATVLEEKINIHDILPQARVVVLDNSTAGLESLLHQKPIISYGYPEYHWVTKDLRALHLLNNFVEDLSWHQKEKANKWIAWYYNNYLCRTENETYLKLKEYLEAS